MNIWCWLHSGAPDCVRVASCCSQSLLFISSEYQPSAALSTCCLLPLRPASKVFSPAPRRTVIIPSWNPHRQAHCHICVCGQHTLVREWRELYELTHVHYYATIICRPPEHRRNSPVNNWRIQTLRIRPLKRKCREMCQFKNWCNLKTVNNRLWSHTSNFSFRLKRRDWASGFSFKLSWLI